MQLALAVYLIILAAGIGFVGGYYRCLYDDAKTYRLVKEYENEGKSQKSE